jgi:hypothetical protein
MFMMYHLLALTRNLLFSRRSSTNGLQRLRAKTPRALEALNGFDGIPEAEVLNNPAS